MSLHIRYFALSALVAVTACAELTPTSSITAAISLTDCLGGAEPKASYAVGDPHGQGTELLGLGFTAGSNFVHVDRFDLGRITTATGAPVSQASAKSLALAGSVATGGTLVPLVGEQWAGARLVGELHCPAPAFAGQSIDVTARIASAAQQPASQTNTGPSTPAAQLAWVYQIELEVGGVTMLDACRDPDDVAFPIPGYWDATATYIRDDSRLSFVCLQRDVAKCLRRGYLYESSTPDERVELFEACTRMMRADYCGDGNSYTIDGTQIDQWDNRGVAAPDHLPGVTFEAAWTPHGMACYQHPRWPAEALPGGTLPACLQPAAASSCDSAADAQALWPGQPLMFDASCPEQPCAPSP
jgi:hypothetical protein